MTMQCRCPDCGHEFEAVQKFSDDALTECPNCTGKLRKVFSAVGVVFKGSGFYRTDSRDSGKKSAGSSSSSSSSESTSSSSSSDSSSTSSTASTSSTSSTKTGGESAA